MTRGQKENIGHLHVTRIQHDAQQILRKQEGGKERRKGGKKEGKEGKNNFLMKLKIYYHVEYPKNIK